MKNGIPIFHIEILCEMKAKFKTYHDNYRKMNVELGNKGFFSEISVIQLVSCAWLNSFKIEMA